MADRVVTIFGGSGFLGRHIVRVLARDRWRIRVAVRRPHHAHHLFPLGDVGQIAVERANILFDEDVRRAVAGSHTVINLTGVLYESGTQSFDAIHMEGAGKAADAARAAGASRFVQVSAIGADAQSPSHYARSKAQGEARVLSAFPQATIVRPSILFGPEDQFFNRFAGLARSLPFLPLFGGGENRMQPVYVGDAAEATAKALSAAGAAGQTYELGGPQIYTFRALMEFVCKQTMRSPVLLPLPFAFGHLAAFFAEWLPVPPLTRDQLRLLATDNVVKAGPDAARVRQFSDLGITPAAIEAIVPSYLVPYRRMGQFADIRQD